MTSRLETKHEDGKVYVRWSPDQSWILLQPTDGVGGYVYDKSDVPPIDRSNDVYIKSTPPTDARLLQDDRLGIGEHVQGLYRALSMPGTDYTKSTPPKPVMSPALLALYGEVRDTILFLKDLNVSGSYGHGDALESALAGIRSEYHFPVEWDLPEKADNGERGHGDSSDIITWDPNKDYKPVVGGKRKIRRR